jgi:phosphoglycolate phosphatase-like HAD superfamily hydrolase
MHIINCLYEGLYLRCRRVVKLVLFDIDGTLILTGGAGVKAFERTAATEFHAPRGTENLKFAGRTDSGLVREFFRAYKIEESKENFDRFFDCYVHWLDYLMDKTDGATCQGIWKVIRGLQNLPQPPAFGLLTGNIRLGAEIKLRHFRLWDLFETGAFGSDHEDRNELAVIAQQRGSRLLGSQLSGEEILVIGDTPLDIECARKIGAKSVGVATGGYSLADLQAHNPTYAVDTLIHLDIKAVCA